MKIEKDNRVIDFAHSIIQTTKRVGLDLYESMLFLDDRGQIENRQGVNFEIVWIPTVPENDKNQYSRIRYQTFNHWHYTFIALNAEGIEIIYVPDIKTYFAVVKIDAGRTFLGKQHHRMATYVMGYNDLNFQPLEVYKNMKKYPFFIENQIKLIKNH